MMFPLRGSTRFTLSTKWSASVAVIRRDETPGGDAVEIGNSSETAVDGLELEARWRDLDLQAFDLAELRRELAGNGIGQEAQFLRAKDLRRQGHHAHSRNRRHDAGWPESDARDNEATAATPAARRARQLCRSWRAG